MKKDKKILKVINDEIPEEISKLAISEVSNLSKKLMQLGYNSSLYLYMLIASMKLAVEAKILEMHISNNLTNEKVVLLLDKDNIKAHKNDIGELT